MENENRKLWDELKKVPDWAKKQITGGRLKGMTDIKPQWRYLKLTELFGPCGIGWKFTIDRQWIEEGSAGERAAFVNISLYVKNGESWSDPIQGTGGSMFIAKEKNGLYTSDEAFKMATTDAMSTAAKMLGVASDVYMGGDFDSEYAAKPEDDGAAAVTTEEVEEIKKMLTDTASDEAQFLKYIGCDSVDKMTVAQYRKAIAALKAKKDIAARKGAK